MYERDKRIAGRPNLIGRLWLGIKEIAARLAALVLLFVVVVLMLVRPDLFEPDNEDD